MKKIVIAGGTGFIGTFLNMRFREMGYKVFIVSRNPEGISWNPADLTSAFENAELVVNLAGKSINCRHTQANKTAILDSRINSTSLIGNAIKACKIPPKLWVNASATGIYKPSLSLPMTEDEDVLGTDFLSEVVSQWEKIFFDFQLPDTRQITLRTSVVLGKDGGALSPLVLLTRFGLGGKQAEGTQMFSWIHQEDYFRILLFLMKNTDEQGIFNCTAPQPVSNKEFMLSLQQSLHVPFGIPAPRFVIEFAAKFIGTEPELILNSSYVIPKRLSVIGYQFRFPLIDKALSDLLS